MKVTLLPQPIFEPQQTRIFRVTILLVTATTTVIVVVTIFTLLLKPLKWSTQQFWFAEVILRKRFVQAHTVIFSACIFSYAESFAVDEREPRIEGGVQKTGS